MNFKIKEYLDRGENRSLAQRWLLIGIVIGLLILIVIIWRTGL